MRLVNGCLVTLLGLVAACSGAPNRLHAPQYASVEPAYPIATSDAPTAAATATAPSPTPQAGQRWFLTGEVDAINLELDPGGTYRVSYHGCDYGRLVCGRWS